MSKRDQRHDVFKEGGGELVDRSDGRDEPCVDLSERFEPFVSRDDVVVWENKRGGVRTRWIRTMRSRATMLAQHQAGHTRMGMFPTLRDGHCRWGCLDLDAHDHQAWDRHPDALSLLGFLKRTGIVAYWETSRGDRGVHVWMFFEEPGVPACDLHSFLETLARELRVHGPVDVFPNSARGLGGAVLLPYLGGVANLFDIDLKPVARDRLESNAVTVIPRGRGWPPANFRLSGVSGAGSARGGAFRAVVTEGRAAGLVFDRDGVLQARLGYRNKIAGAIARGIVREGGTFSDFQAWDSHNEPPLAQDEPGSLLGWWKWATRRASRPNAGDSALKEAS